MAPPSKPDRTISIQAMLFMAFGVGLLMTVLGLRFNFADKSFARDQARIASDAMVHSQRIAKAAPHAARGNPEAVTELQESRAQLTRNLALMVDAGSPPANRNKLLAQLKTKVASTDQAAGTILRFKSELAAREKTLELLDALTPEMLAMSEELLNQKIRGGSTARELVLTGRLTMLTQRLSYNANEFVTSGGIRPESAFELGRDSANFRSTLNGLLDGSEAMQLKPEQDPDLRALLDEMKTRSDTYHQLVSSMLANLPKYGAAKGAELSIMHDNEELTLQLRQFRSGLGERQRATGAGFWFMLAAAVLSAAVGIALAVRMLNDTGPQNGATMPLRVMCLAAGGVILIAVFALGIRAAGKTGSSDHERMASDALMHSQRIAKAAPNAIEGNVEAFAQLEESRRLLAGDLGLLDEGPAVDSVTVAAAPPGMRKMMVKAQNQWRNSVDAAEIILTTKPELTGYGKSLMQLKTLAPELLSMTEDLLARGVRNGASARELAAAGRIGMLTQRLSVSASKLLVSETVHPEIVFQLGLDTRNFRTTIAGLLDGNPAMQLNPATDPEVRKLIGEIESKFETVDKLVVSVLDNLQKFTSAKNAEVEIRHENEEGRKMLANLQTSFQQRTDPAAIWFWIIAIVALFTAAAAAVIGRGMLRQMES